MNTLIAVNGPTQLLSAVVALEELAQGSEGMHILGINLPRTISSEQDEALVGVIRACAETLHKWAAVVDLRTLPLRPGRGLQLPDGREIEIDSLFVNLMEMPENQRLFAQWPQAQRVCYGDGLGIHTALSDFMADATWRDHARRALGVFIPRLRPSPRPQKTPGDIGCFLLDDHEAQKHFREVRMISPARYRAHFERMAAALEVPGIEAWLDQLPADGACDVLLLTNLPAGVIHADHEVQAYLRLLDDAPGQRPGAILVKAHPRGRADFVSELSAHLAKLYTRVIVLAQDMAIVPVEVLLARAFQAGKLIASRCRIFATSTAAYSMPVMFGLPVTLGFGKSNCRRLYRHAGWRSARLRHEQTLCINMSLLTHV